jgi:hypothetical protein
MNGSPLFNAQVVGLIAALLLSACATSGGSNPELACTKGSIQPIYSPDKVYVGKCFDKRDLGRAYTVGTRELATAVADTRGEVRAYSAALQRYAETGYLPDGFDDEQALLHDTRRAMDLLTNLQQLLNALENAFREGGNPSRNRTTARSLQELDAERQRNINAYGSALRSAAAAAERAGGCPPSGEQLLLAKRSGKEREEVVSLALKAQVSSKPGCLS